MFYKHFLFFLAKEDIAKNVNNKRWKGKAPVKGKQHVKKSKPKGELLGDKTLPVCETAEGETLNKSGGDKTIDEVEKQIVEGVDNIDEAAGVNKGRDRDV